MKLKIVDEVLDYKKAAANLEIPFTEKVNIPSHSVELHIEDWPIEFTNSVRYILFKLHPTTRLIAKITTTDLKMFPEFVENRLNSVYISADCPLGMFKYDVVHTHPFDNPLNITLSDSSIGKYINKFPITVLDKGRTLSIVGEVIRSCGFDTGNTNFDFCATMIRKSSEFYQYTKNGISYNKGVCRIVYQDTLKAQDVMKNVFIIFAELIGEIKDNLDLYVTELVDIPRLNIPRDRSGIIGHCVKHYIYSLGDEDVKQIPQAVQKSGSDVGWSTITFKGGKLSIVKPAIQKALTTLHADIKKVASL